MTVEAEGDSTAMFTLGEQSELSRAERRAAERAQQQRSRRLGLGIYGAILAVLGLSIPVLGYIGVRAVLNSSDGEVINPVLDPTQPRYQALVPPSPTLLVLQVDENNELAGVALLAQAGVDRPGGSVLVVPPRTAADIPDIGVLPLAASYAFSGPDATRSAVEWALHLGIEAVVTLDPDAWADELSKVGTLRISNPDELRDQDGKVLFPAGALELAPSEVPAFAAFQSPDESPLNRLMRQELVWNAWLAQLSPGDETPAGADGEPSALDTFLGRVVAGGYRVATAPVVVDGLSPLPEGGSGLRIDEEALNRLIPSLIPFPAGSASNSRPLVRVLAGTDDRTTIEPAVRRVIEAGGQVSMVGNAEHFEYETTEILYFDPARRSFAQAVADRLGFGNVARVNEIDDSAAVIVVLGADANF